MNTKDFALLVEQYNKLIFTVCYRFINDYQYAENLTQDTFLMAYKTIDNFIGDNYKAWLIKIAANKCKDYLKSSYIKRVDVKQDEDMVGISDSINVQLELERSESVTMIKQACESLDEPYRNVAIMHYIEEKSFSEISILLDVPVKTIQTQTYRARDKLRKMLKEELCDV